MKSTHRLAMGLALGASVCLFASLLLLAEVSVGSTRTSSQFVTTASSSTPQDALLKIRHVWISQEEADPLLGELAKQLARGLTNLPAVEVVERTEIKQMAPQFPICPVGQPLPDLFLRLQKVESKRTGIFVKTTENKIIATLATAPWAASHHYFDDTTPPLVSFHWQGRIEETRATKGLGLNRPSVIAAEIADQLLKGMSNQMASLRKAHPLASAGQNALVPPYQATPPLKPIASLQGALVCSGPRLLSPNETYWLIPSRTDPASIFTLIRDELVKEGWQVQSAELADNPYLRLRQERRTIECFLPSGRGGIGQLKDNETANLIVHYREALDSRKKEELLDNLAHTLSQEELLAYQHHLSHDQQIRFWDKMKGSPAPSAHLLAALAKFECQRGNTPEARRWAGLARLLEYEAENQNTIQSRFEELEKKTGKIRPIEPIASDLKTLGFILIHEQTSTHPCERALGEPLRLAWNDQKGEMHLVSLLVNQTTSQRSDTYDFIRAERHKHGRSMSHLGIALSTNKDYVCDWGPATNANRVRIRLAPQGRRVLFQLEPDQN